MDGLDIESRPVTPEGVQLSLRVAGPPIRLLAWTLDAVVVLGVLIFATAVLSLLGAVGLGLSLLLTFALFSFYPVVFEVYFGGSTLGKRVCGLRVVHDDGTPVSFSSSLLRNLLRSADFLPIVPLTGLLSMLLSRDFRRLGDLVAGTLVVYRDRSVLTGLVTTASPVAPGVGLSREEQRVVIDYATRRQTWTEERAIELADVVWPLTGARGPEGDRRLVGIATWLMGRREETS